MPSLRLVVGSWNSKAKSINSRSIKRSSHAYGHSSQMQLPLLAEKAIKLQAARPRAAAVIEGLIDDALAQIAGAK